MKINSGIFLVKLLYVPSPLSFLEHVELKDKIEPGKMEMLEGPNHTYKVDQKGMKKYRDRVANGFRLFGKYYDHLWD